ncbi:IS110 family transposase [Thermodesulfobacteriota bacterium B35]
MNKTVRYLGLDVHKNSIVLAAADSGSRDEAEYVGTIDHDMSQLDKIIRKYISRGFDVDCVYEAGPCGYEIHRHLTGNGIACSVIAPSRIPRQSGDRVKTDRRDAKTLARLHRAGELTPVYVPTVEDEALRDLVRAREDSKQALRRTKQQLGAFLLRRSIIYPGKTPWSKAHFNWLADITMEHRAQQIVLQEYIDAICTCQERVDRITQQIYELSEQSRLKPLIDALASMRGISTLIATILAAELGDLHRFDHPEQLMAYVGLIPSEHSSGPKVRKGTITKTGNGHVRKSLVEAAQAYRLPARKSRAILKRQQGVPKRIQEIAWKAQCRLCGRYRRLIGKGKKANVAKIAVARELVGFAWAVAQEIQIPATA